MSIIKLTLSKRLVWKELEQRQRDLSITRDSNAHICMYVHICIESLELKILWLYINHNVEQILTNKVIERIYELLTLEHAHVWLLINIK